MSDGKQGKIRQGIEFDVLGRRVGYHFFKAHPYDYDSTMERGFVADTDCCHLFEPWRMNAIRGLPVAIGVVNTLRDLGIYMDAYLTRAGTQASVVGVVSTDDENDTGMTGTGDALITDAAGKPVDQIRAGSLLIARGGKSTTFANTAGDPALEATVRAFRQEIALGVSMTYEQLSGDMSNATYATARIGGMFWRQTCNALRNLYVIPQFCDPIARRFVEAAKLAGKVKSSESVSVSWFPEPIENPNPTEQTQADKELMQNGGLLVSQYVERQLGMDIDTYANAMRADIEALKDIALMSVPSTANQGKQFFAD